MDSEKYQGRSYYNGTECLDAMRKCYGDDAVSSFCMCNAFKYLWRCRAKHETPLEDLRKAQWYIARTIEFIEQKDKQIDNGAESIQ